MRSEGWSSKAFRFPYSFSFPITWRGALVLLLLVVLFVPALPVSAQEGEGAEEELPYQSALMIEAETGHVLFAHEPDQRRLPASIVKMMLMLVVMEMAERGETDLDEPIRASADASRIGGSQVFLKEGEVFPLRELLKAVVIASANDAAVAIAEGIVGATEEFVEIMNERAEELGMTGTHYTNVHGLPAGPRKEENFTTARDIALLAQQLARFPLLLEWGSTFRDDFRNGEFTLYNTNDLVRTFSGVDGFKTGHLEEAGFNLSATADRGGLRLISVVLGSLSSSARFKATRGLLARGFRRYKKVTLFSEGDPVGDAVLVTKGEKRATTLIAGETVKFVILRKDESRVTTRRKLPEPLEAPLTKGQRVGELEIVVGDQVIKTAPLLASEEIGQANLFRRFIDLFNFN